MDNKAGNITSIKKGQQIGITKQNTKDQEKSTISLYYDALGNLTKTIDQQGITTYHGFRKRIKSINEKP